MGKKFPLIGAAVITAAALLSGCGQKTDYYFIEPYSYAEYLSSRSEAFEGYAGIMGTEAIVHITDADNFADEAVYNRATELWGDIKELLISVNSSLSTTVTTSYVYKFNEAAAGSEIEIDALTFEALSIAKKIYEETGGYYNPAVYQSVRLYGFGGSQTALPDTLPDAETVSAYRRLSGEFKNMGLREEGGRYYAKKPDAVVNAEGAEQSLKLDLGGIGKGLCADKISDMTKEAGFGYGYFSFGSSSMAIGEYVSNEDKTYNLSSQDPRGSGGYCSVRVKNSRLSTSADYEQHYLLDGVWYCHIIDPTTGSPIQTGVASATVIGGSAAEDDAITTALCAMGKERAVEYINAKLTDRTVIMLVFENGQGKVITNRPDEVKILNESYVLANTVMDGKIVLI